MRRFLGRGEKPNELGDSWLPKKMNLSSILNLLKKQQNQKVSLDYSQKRDSSSGTEKNL